MAGTVEAIIGAVYLDGGMESATGVMQNLGLIPRIVRKIRLKTPLSESAESPSVSMFTVKNHKKPKMAPRDSEERSQELEKSVREHSTVVQLKQRPNENTQSPERL